MSGSTWGKLPEQLKSECRKKYWETFAKRRAILLNEIAFPLTLSLKIPTGKQAMAQPEHYRQFVDAWRAFRQPENVIWAEHKLAYFGEQDLPSELCFQNIHDLLKFIGEEKTWSRWQNRLADWQTHFPPHAHTALIFKIEELDALPEKTLSMLIKVVLQLRAGMGRGGYLRALPLVGAHSKFIEQHFALIEYLMAAIHGETVCEQGLLAWLNCATSPKDWLLVHPLCAKTQAALANLPLLRLNSHTLQHTPLPAQRILIVENEQAALSLPNLPDTIAIAGGGRNTAWFSAKWLLEKQVAYWGDLDAHGLTILSEARVHLPQLPSLMMNKQVLDLFADFMTDDVAHHLPEPPNLHEAEREAWQCLQSQHGRLEQEYLSADFVMERLNDWISGNLKIQ
ncbi:MAG: DUF3322 domain-containing protein [Alysiella sp.]|uniref:DUF3322 domain-containing protein n=1 Tax=Alysiella sp. TaxID=1872483 RepID=UPI0026DD96CD|nr:DUF3322 domain-containing protein [Alysiella sp.]MDO4433214.1 DUF3322 domain-containing protein [Alysiella sp.]